VRFLSSVVSVVLVQDPGGRHSRPLPLLAGASRVLRRHQTHVVLGGLVAAVAAPQAEVDAALLAVGEVGVVAVAQVDEGRDASRADKGGGSGASVESSSRTKVMIRCCFLLRVSLNVFDCFFASLSLARSRFSSSSFYGTDGTKKRI